MSPEIRCALDEVLQETSHWKDSTEKLVCFCPMRGSSADGRLMLVGRALNGWGEDTSFKALEMVSKEAREKILDNTMKKSSSDSGCPIQSLHDSWRKKDSKYKLNRSQFWSVAREVIKKFSTTAENEKWANYLYWTNLYKVSPEERRNPSQSLKLKIDSSSWKMLIIEIELLQPKRILFLTGQGWAEQFLKSTTFRASEVPQIRRVFQTGFLPFHGGEAAVVVSDHPQAKKRREIVDGVLDAFAKLGRGSCSQL